MTYKKILAEKLDMPKIFLDKKIDLEEISTDARFQMDIADGAEEGHEKTGTAYLAIKDGIVFCYYPEWYFEQENEPDETPEEYFKRKKANFKELDKIAREIAKMPEWSRCKNKSQRDMVVDKFLVETENKDFYRYDLERIADYVKIFVEGSQ